METNDKFRPFANRLEKVTKHTGKWTRREGITCYRVYDNDMPEFPLAIDRYEGIVHVAEYARAHGMTPDEHAEWLQGCIEVISRVMETPVEQIYLKFRQRQEGLRQYEKFGRKGIELTVRENGLKFIINPADYLDTGLFLDHRNTRALVRSMAAGKKVLNLFAYTGSFTVYAAAGGAAATLTLDLSNTYLTWAKQNLKINALNGPQHRFLQTDVLAWMREPATEKWDVIVLDPPTFSNSKRMKGTLDVQRDHIWLVERTAERLAPGGVLFFSTNLKKFRPDWEALPALQVKNISDYSVGDDFRDKRIHHCFEIRWKGDGARTNASKLG